MKTLALLFLSSFTFATSMERLIDKTETKIVKIGIVTDKGRGVCSGAFIDENFADIKARVLDSLKEKAI